MSGKICNEKSIRQSELLAPAGDFNKLKTALHFGADAVYVGGNSYGLRQNAKNFTDNELIEAVQYVHERDKKIYVTCNIVAHNEDFDGLAEYIAFLDNIGIDALIISDLGVFELAYSICKHAELHVSTQANVTNKYAVMTWVKLGAKRIVLARELSVKEIREIRDSLPSHVELESFVHGAMCISHSGRCLLSNYLTNRDGNRGGCVQACRWEYTLHEKNRPDNPLTMTEDSRGTYIMNSKDLNMLEHIEELMECGVFSLKVEGRMKSQYYVATVINAYRQVIDQIMKGNREISEGVKAELFKTSHRQYTTGFYYGESDSVALDNSQTAGEYDFIAEVLGYDDDKHCLIVEQRNRFATGETLEILSADNNMTNCKIVIEKMTDLEGNEVVDAKLVQQKLLIYTNLKLQEMDILRKRRDS